MTKYTFATLPRWATKVNKVQDAIVGTATSEMIGDIRVAPGINRGGGRTKGTVPRDLGALAGSLNSSLNGGAGGSGVAAAALVAGGMKAGDIASFSWGGDAAPYAKYVHYGAKGVPGTFWIDVAASKWPGYVASAVAKARAQFG